MINCPECGLLVQMPSRCLLSRVLCCMVDCDNLHIVYVEALFVLILILSIFCVLLKTL